MTTDDLARLRSLAEAATPGPWGFASGDAHHAAHVITAKGTLRFVGYNTTRYHDAALIAAMRNALGELLDAAALGLAWNRVEAALPDGWFCSLGSHVSHAAIYHAVAQADFEHGLETVTAGGPTPTAALLALADKLEPRK